MLERDYASAEKILADYRGEKFACGARRHFIRVGPPSPAATSNRPSVTLPRRRQLSKDRCATIPPIQSTTRNSDYSMPTCTERRMPSEKVVGQSNSSQKARTHFMALFAAGNLALVYALVGEQDQAITLIERLLSTPGPIQWLESSTEHHAGRASSALGMGLAAQQPAFPENPRRTGAQDSLLRREGSQPRVLCCFACALALSSDKSCLPFTTHRMRKAARLSFNFSNKWHCRRLTRNDLRGDARFEKIVAAVARSAQDRVGTRTYRGTSERNPETFRGGSGENRWKRNSPEPKTMKNNPQFSTRKEILKRTTHYQEHRRTSKLPPSKVNSRVRAAALLVQGSSLDGNGVRGTSGLANHGVHGDSISGRGVAGDKPNVLWG